MPDDDGLARIETLLVALPGAFERLASQMTALRQQFATQEHRLQALGRALEGLYEALGCDPDHKKEP